jgi:uncharacterized membrane protein
VSLNEEGKQLGKMKIKQAEIIEKLDAKEDRRKGFKILGYSIWVILAYFVLYSILGFALETVYGLLTKGVIESRKSFLYGPFCGIYGLGAVIMILLLQYFKKNNYTLFFGGYVIGSIIEYFVSLFGELILHVKWWDYSAEPFNVNGRICLVYSFFWGFLAIYLIRRVNPRVDSIIEKIRSKLPKYLLPVVFDISAILLVCDCIISAVAINVFYSRIVYTYNIDIPNASVYVKNYEKIMENESWYKFTEKYFSNEKMLKTYPNLKMEATDGSIIYMKDILSDIKPYYVKLFSPSENKVHITGVEKVTYDGNK